MTHELAPGALIAGKYQIERVLGEGGMGLVLQARHTQLGQTVAIKVIRPEVAAGNEMSQRFQREARAAATLTSEHVVRVFDVGVLPSGAPFMVMEYVEGQDLARLLATRGPLPWAEAVGYVLEACVGLAEAHARGIIHRDLKPSNLFLARQSGNTWRIKVLDFGVAKAPAERAATAILTTASLSGEPAGLTGVKMLGTPYYMAPEQFRSARDVDVRADVWGLGVILFDLLTGAPPFPGNTLDQLLSNMAAGAPSVRVRRPDVPEELAQIIGACLQPDLARRLATVGRLAAALARLVPSQMPLADRIAHVLGEPPPSSFAMAATVRATAIAPPPRLFSSTAETIDPASHTPGLLSPSAGPLASSVSLGAGAAPVAASRAAGPPSWLLALVGVGALGTVGLVAGAGYLVTHREREPTAVPVVSPQAPALRPASALSETEPLPAIDRQRVDMTRFYPAARAAALRKDPHAQLISISSSRTVGGLANIDDPNVVVSYLFTSPTSAGASRQTMITLSSGGLTVFQSLQPGATPTPVAGPRCLPEAVWQAVSAREAQGQLSYMLYPNGNGMGACWVVAARDTPQRVVDDATCREVKF